MASRKFVIGGAAVAALFGRLRRRPASEPPPEDDEEEAGEELAAEEVLELREELRNELERLASADVKALRTRSERPSSPG